jgi:hypothetical protein
MVYSQALWTLFVLNLILAVSSFKTSMPVAFELQSYSRETFRPVLGRAAAIRLTITSGLNSGLQCQLLQINAQRSARPRPEVAQRDREAVLAGQSSEFQVPEPDTLHVLCS